MEPHKEVSVLIGGRAGDGISSAGLLVAHLLGKLGYRIYMYFDYPSLVKGGHNFAIVRASSRPIGAVRDRVDFVLAINQDTIRFHEPLFHEGTVIIYNADTVKSGGIGVKVDEILKSESGLPVMSNSCMIGAFARAAGIEWAKVEEVFRKSIPKMVDLNLRVARRAYEGTPDVRAVTPVPQAILPVLSGDEAIALGLVQSGLESYFSYPMSPTSDILHFLAAGAENFGIRAIQPESETAAILMALGCAYAGKRAAVGTSGGGFCLMAESLGLAGMAELPVVIAIGQRPGPSTGLATYTAQSDLHFILNASQGEFPRFIAAPGNAEEAYFWSTAAMELAWKYQIPAFILADKTVCEGMYSFFRE
ncbi:MAG: 2-oxoacid:acceptor oxidoreductase family protein, partial [Methanoregulaceae archaeon]|nr:2-oxoacid:acceptor oxidoreductase family protein [Methanoregulaceae archaeon]